MAATPGIVKREKKINELIKVVGDPKKMKRKSGIKKLESSHPLFLSILKKVWVDNRKKGYQVITNKR